MSGHQIPEFIDRFLVDPRAFLVIIASSNEALLGQVWLPILHRDSDGNSMFGPGTAYPYILATCDGFWLADETGRGRADYTLDPGDRIIGVTFTSPEGNQFVCSPASIVAVTRDGTWPESPSLQESIHAGGLNRPGGGSERG